MKKKELTAEELLNLPETKKILDTYGDEYIIKVKIKKDLAKTKNYKPNVFYHATGGFGEPGVGCGLYLGKDKKALYNFYNLDRTESEIIEYHGNPKFVDLTDFTDFEQFKEKAIRIYGNRKSNEHFKLLTTKIGYDGIRYYDPIATGEEFVLFKIEKVKKVGVQKKSNENIYKFKL